MSHKAIFVQPGGGYDRVVVGTSEAATPGAVKSPCGCAPTHSTITISRS